MTTSVNDGRGFQLQGIVPIIPTAFEENQEVDWESLQALVDFACASGACAMCLPAYASEFYTLSENERRRAIADAVKQASGRIPVIGQVNAFSCKAGCGNRARGPADGNGCALVSAFYGRIMETCLLSKCSNPPLK